MATWTFIDSDSALRELVTRLGDQDIFALDTEFHRERTYFPQLALVQVAIDEDVFLIDPLECDIALMADLFADGPTMIVHAARQDLEVLENECGVAPGRIFDTQLAGGFLGYATPSLSSLLERELGVSMPKANRLSDWLRRPLSEKQQEYAALDVAHLVRLARQLGQKIEEKGRVGWLQEATDELMAEPRGPRDPQQAWRRIKEVRHLRGVDLATAQGLAAWREQRAASLDITPRYVLADLGVVGLAVARPSTVEGLSGIRGLDTKSVRSVSAELLEVVSSSAERTPTRDPRRDKSELSPSIRPAIPLVSAWVSQVARNIEVDPAILATRADIEALLKEDPNARLAKGWRLEQAGEQIRRLIHGEVALAFDRANGLVLEPRNDRGAE